MGAHVIWRGMSSYIAAWCRDMPTIWQLTYAEWPPNQQRPRWRLATCTSDLEGNIPHLAPIVHWPLQCACQIFHIGDWWLPGDCVCGLPETPSGADSWGVGPSPDGWLPAAGPEVYLDCDVPAWNRFSWHACQVFWMPKLASKSGGGGMSWPIYIVCTVRNNIRARFYLWRNVGTTWNNFLQSSLHLRAKGRIVLPSVFNLPYLCEH